MRGAVETGIAFARSCAPGVETAIAFAGEKWVFFVHFSVAEASSVSTLAVQGRALVMVVSRWSAAVVAEASSVSTVAVLGRALVMVVSRWSAAAVAEASSVSTSPPHSCLCAKKFALLGLMVGLCAKKFALRTKYGPKSVVCGVLGEFFRENTAGGVVLGELFRARCGKGRHSDGFFVEKSCF